MGCGGSSGEADGKYLLRVLVLGTSACGKSTFTRQLKILYCDGFTSEEEFNYKNILVQNLLLGFREIILSLEIEWPKKLSKIVKFFKDVNAYTTQIDDGIVKKAQAVWETEQMQTALASSNKKFEFAESLHYVMDNIGRIAGDAWAPTHEDILHVRQRTTGIVETRFRIDKHNWVVIDVGGQRVERRKWVHSQTNLTAVIYFAALDEYDVLGEEENKSGMQESLEVWEETVNGFTQKLPVILFLNKRDLFEEKLKRVSMKKTYKSYKGGKDFKEGVEFIKNLYFERIKDNTLEPYVHVTCAIDTENIRVVFQYVKDFIFKARLRVSGL